MNWFSNLILSLSIMLLVKQFESCLCLNSPDDDPKTWFLYARERITRFENFPNSKFAKSPKNIILFVGDGMGIDTLTATRYLKAQLVNKSAGEAHLVWDEWTVSSLVQTFSADRMTTDSGAAATALFSGAKGNHDTVGLTGGARCCECYKLRDDQVARSALRYAIDAGLSTGFVTTTTVTHATPGATYAGTPFRGWESQMHNNTQGDKIIVCKDIASQMVEKAIDFNVIMGGGWKHFYRTPSAHTPQSAGGRTDSQNLLDQWFDIQTKKRRKFAMVYDKESLLKLDLVATDYLLGLFNNGHMKYDLERGEEPSLSEMVKVAINVLSKNCNGYLLMVEGGRIDHGHHANQAQNALTDTLAMEKAVRQAVSQVSLDETLIVVTADHAHSFGLVGYASRDRNIFDTVDKSPIANDNKHYLISTYFNGPAALNNMARRDPIDDLDRLHFNYRQQSLVPLPYASHSAADVALYAIGPYSNLFYGSHDNTYVGHVIMYSLCLGPYKNLTHCEKSSNDAFSFKMYHPFNWIPVAITMLFVHSQV